MSRVGNSKSWMPLLSGGGTKWREEAVRVHQLVPRGVKPCVRQVTEPWRISVQFANIRELCSRCSRQYLEELGSFIPQNRFHPPPNLLRLSVKLSRQFFITRQSRNRGNRGCFADHVTVQRRPEA